MKKYIPTICGLLFGAFSGIWRLFFTDEMISPNCIFLYAAIGGLLGILFSALSPMFRRMNIVSPMLWLIGCAALVLLAFFSIGQGSTVGFYLFPVGVIGMVVSIILIILSRISSTKRNVSPEAVDAKQKRPRLLAFLCIAHAILPTTIMGYAFNYSGPPVPSIKSIVIGGIFWLFFVHGHYGLWCS